MSQPTLLPISHRGVLAVALPIMLANVTEPLIGVVNTAVIGRLPEPYYIGAIALGGLIFSFIFWGFGFLRLGTSGFAAQALGGGEHEEIVAVLGRGLLLALVCGLVLILLSPMIATASFSLLEGSPEMERHAERYFFVRIFAAPFALANFCILGWFVGLGRARLGFLVQVTLNLVNAGLSALFVLRLGMTSGGVGLAALIAEIVAMILGLILVGAVLRGAGWRFSLPRILDRRMLWRTLVVNRDIMIRTVCLVFAFAYFASRGAKLGDVALAANTVLLHLFELAAYMVDGFANAMEALAGQAAGARDLDRYRRATRIAWIWAMASGFLLALAVLLLGPSIIALLTVNPEIRAVAAAYLPWCAASVLIGTIAFQYDGIYTGLMATRPMRNNMVLSLLGFLGLAALLEPLAGNHGLWLALTGFFALRAVTFAASTPRAVAKAFADTP